MAIFSDACPRIKVYASAHQTLTLHGSSAGGKYMQYNTVAYNNGPSGFYNWNGATGYAGKNYSIQCGQYGQYEIVTSILCNRTTTGGYIHAYAISFNSSGTAIDSALINHERYAGPGASGWAHMVETCTLLVEANGIVQTYWYMNNANTVSTYLSHLGVNYCYMQLTHLA